MQKRSFSYLSEKNIVPVRLNFSINLIYFMSIVKFETAHRFNLDIFLMDMNCQIILVRDAIADADCPIVYFPLQ